MKFVIGMSRGAAALLFHVLALAVDHELPARLPDVMRGISRRGRKLLDKSHLREQCPIEKREEGHR